MKNKHQNNNFTSNYNYQKNKLIFIKNYMNNKKIYVKKLNLQRSKLKLLYQLKTHKSKIKIKKLCN